MNDNIHVMAVESSRAHEYLFVCPVDGCGRRFVLKTAGAGDLIVLDRGDPTALHQGSIGDIAMTGSLASTGPLDEH